MSMQPRKYHGPELKCAGAPMCRDCADKQAERGFEDSIREMARLTMLSNRLNYIQEKNLKMFPMVYFNGVSTADILFDLSNGREFITETQPQDPERPEGKYVSYRLTIDESQDNGNLEFRFKVLEDSVRNLFWSDTAVMVFFNGKKVFESEKKDENSNSK